MEKEEDYGPAGYLNRSPVASPEMTFPQAIEKVIAGKKVTKKEWGNAGIYVMLNNGYLSIKRTTGIHQLIVSEGDMKGEDWIVVTEKGGREAEVTKEEEE